MAVAALLFVITVWLRWPGVPMYDSVSQYGQALDGIYSDWHPPIMARAWALLARIAPGGAPFFLIQMVLLWGGLALLATTLARRGKIVAPIAVLAVGASPLFLGWLTVLLKDAQMACCLIAGAGLAAGAKIEGKPVGIARGAAILILLAYATLVRGNALFATVPFALALFDWGGARRWTVRAVMLLVALGAVLAVSPWINHRLLGATASHVERTLPIYDLAGVSHHAGLETMPRLARGDWKKAEQRGCYSPFFWNPYGEPAQCDFVGQALAFDGAGPGPTRDWIVAIVTHPIAYARHRLGHLNANLRFWVGPGERDAVPPTDPEPNPFGLGAPARPPARLLVRAAAWMTTTPFGWPVMWLALALGLLWAGAAAKGGQAALGRALALSAAMMSASFAIVSIASDLRYHLWSMIAAALALVLLADARALALRRALIAGAILVAIAGAGIAARHGWADPVYTPIPAYVPPPPLHP